MRTIHRQRWNRWLLAAVLPVALLGTGCHATGMGWIPSSLAPGDKATFGFSFDGPTIDSPTGTLSGSYHDPQGRLASGAVVSVDLKGTGKLSPCSTDPRCQTLAPPSKGGCVAGEPDYQSQNQKVPGGGFLFLLLCDVDGDGQTDGTGSDFIFIQVDTGPYTGYRNFGNPQGEITVRQ